MKPAAYVTQLIDLVKAGDDEATAAIWEHYFPQLLHFASRQLSGQSRGEADEEDIVLSAFASFCKAATMGRFPDLRDREGLWRLLSQMTRRKAVDLIRRRHRQKRGADRTHGESALGQSAAGPRLDDLAVERMTPELSLLLQDQCRRLLEMLLQQMALLKLAGHTNREIADQLSCSVATVERRLQLIRKRWVRELAHDD